MNINEHIVKLKNRYDSFTGVFHCRECASVLTDIDTKYCSVCGGNLLRKGKVHQMVYKAIKTTENGKALACPHCDNEELTHGDFCIICGSNIINRCSDTTSGSGEDISIKKSCGNILPGNARYCNKCGNESAFFQKGWLPDWRSENVKKAIKNSSVALDYDKIKEKRAYK